LEVAESNTTTTWLPDSFLLYFIDQLPKQTDSSWYGLNLSHQSQFPGVSSLSYKGRIGGYVNLNFLDASHCHHHPLASHPFMAGTNSKTYTNPKNGSAHGLLSRCDLGVEAGSNPCKRVFIKHGIFRIGKQNAMHTSRRALNTCLVV
jgi:hypothetical protein